MSNWKEVLKIAWPLIVANSFWNLQVTIDRIYLGNYSTESLAAAISAVGVFWAPMALVQQTAAYVTTFVAQYYGARKSERIGPAVWQSTYLSLIGGLLFLILIPVAPALFRLFGHSPALQVLETEYFQALCYSALPTALIATASGFFTGLGRSSIILWINGVGLVSNVLFDYVLIFGHWGFPELGIAGAGYATGLANLVAAAVGMFIVFHPRSLQRYPSLIHWRWDGDLMRRFVRFGIPSGMQWALEGLAFTVFLVIVGRMPNGDAALAASGITITVMMLAILPPLGVAQAVTVLVGQNLGENKPALAEQATWNGVQIALVYIVATGLTFVLFPNFYLAWFHNAEDPGLWEQVGTMVPYLLMFVAVFILFDSLNLMLSFALKGAGDTRFVTLIALTLPWPLMVIPTWVVAGWDHAIYWAWGAASIFIISQALIFLWRFRQGKWKDMRVIEK